MAKQQTDRKNTSASKTSEQRVGEGARKALTSGLKPRRKVSRSPKKPSNSRGRPRRGPQASRSPRRRTRYTEAQRRRILDTAGRQGLTATQVHKRFGVTPVTYYAWKRMTAGVSDLASGAIDLASALRIEVKRQIRDLLPEIIRSELDSFGKSRRSRRE
jgi:transposase-like protein